MVRAVLAALLALLLAVPGAAQETGGVAWLTGRWQGVGTLFLQRSAATLEVRPVLGGRFIELSYRTRSDGREFEGRALYRPAGEGRWRATWFDNRGTTFPIEAILSGQTLTADWGSAETERGRTIYRLLPDGRLEVTDHAGGREFARHILTRG